MAAEWLTFAKLANESLRTLLRHYYPTEGDTVIPSGMVRIHIEQGHSLNFDQGAVKYVIVGNSDRTIVGGRSQGSNEVQSQLHMMGRILRNLVSNLYKMDIRYPAVDILLNSPTREEVHITHAGVDLKIQRVPPARGRPRTRSTSNRN